MDLNLTKVDEMRLDKLVFNETIPETVKKEEVSKKSLLKDKREQEANIELKDDTFVTENIEVDD
jgi:hypothetical protein